MTKLDLQISTENIHRGPVWSDSTWRSLHPVFERISGVPPDVLTLFSMWLPGAPCFHAWLWEQSVLPAFQNILHFWNLEDCIWMESTIASVYDPPVSSGVVDHLAYFHEDQRCVLVLGRSVLPSKHENPLLKQSFDPVTGYGKTLVLDAKPWFQGRRLQLSSVRACFALLVYIEIQRVRSGKCFAVPASLSGIIKNACLT